MLLRSFQKVVASATETAAAAAAAAMYKNLRKNGLFFAQKT
jgi:hypothetical protein